MKRGKTMRMTENDIIAAYVKSRYPNLIKTTDYSAFAAGKRIISIFESIDGLFKIRYAQGGVIISERELEDGRYEEGTSDGSTETPDGIRGEESICGEPVSDSEHGNNLQED